MIYFDQQPGGRVGGNFPPLKFTFQGLNFFLQLKIIEHFRFQKLINVPMEPGNILMYSIFFKKTGRPGLINILFNQRPYFGNSIAG